MGGGIEQKPGGSSLVQQSLGSGLEATSPGKRTLTEQLTNGAPATMSNSSSTGTSPAGVAAGGGRSTAAGAASSIGPVQAKSIGSGGAHQGEDSSPETGHSGPFEHEGHKIKVELGQGSVTGAITLSLEVGKTGVPLNDQVKAFKNTASLKLNGFIMKLETAVLNGKLDDEILDGVKVAVEVSALKASSDGSSASMDLLTVALKLQGDVGHWIGADPNVKLMLEGQVQVALGGKLAAKLASYTVAQLEQQMLAKEIEAVGGTVAKHVESIESLESKLTALKANPSAARRELQALEHELFQHRIQVSTGGQQLKGLTHRLSEAKGRANAVLRRLEGKFAKKVAWAMEKKTVKFVAKTLSKLLPVLNLVSTIADVIELIGIIRSLIKGQFGDSGDDEGTQEAPSEGTAEGRHDGGAGGAGSAARDGSGDRPGVDQSTGEGGDGSTHAAGTASSTKVDLKKVEEARKTLSPNARTVIDTLIHKGTKGPALDPDQLKMAGLLVPADLSPEQLHEVISHLHGSSSVARTPEDAIVAIDQAVRDVRNKNRTVTVDGVSRPDLAQPDGGLQDGGPVTSPSQVDGGSGSSPAEYDEALAIVRAAPPAVVGRWFQVRERELMLSDEGKDWKARHLNTRIGGQMLLDAQHIVGTRGENKWTVTLVFKLGTAAGRSTIHHEFFVDRGGEVSGLGAKVGELIFEPYTMITSP